MFLYSFLVNKVCLNHLTNIQTDKHTQNNITTFCKVVRELVVVVDVVYVSIVVVVMQDNNFFDDGNDEVVIACDVIVSVAVNSDDADEDEASDGVGE